MHLFDVLSDPVRRRILELLGPGEMASGEVVEAIGAEFGITQAAVSQHLKVLRESGFAKVRADAQRRLYSVDVAGLQAVDAWIGQFRSFWEPKLDALATEIARGKRARRNAPMTKRTGKRAQVRWRRNVLQVCHSGRGAAAHCLIVACSMDYSKASPHFRIGRHV